MSWKKTVGPWMLQICTLDIWSHCQCGYLYFYDAMRVMEMTLAAVKVKGSTPTEPQDLFSLAAACLIASFELLHPEDLGAYTTLLHLLVHRLQRVYSLSPRGRLGVTYSSISKAMDTVVRSRVVSCPSHGILREVRSDACLFLDLLDWIEAEGETMNDVRRPIVDIKHLDCSSQYFGVVAQVIASFPLAETSRWLVANIHAGRGTQYEKRLWHEAKILHPEGDSMTLRIQQALASWKMAPLLPHIAGLMPLTLVWTMTMMTPERFWMVFSKRASRCFLNPPPPPPPPFPWVWQPLSLSE